MPALVVTGAVLVLIMCGIEIYTVRKYPAIGRFLENHTWATLFFSIGISAFMGFFIPIAGISAMIGFFGSTLLMQVYYAWIRFVHRIAAKFHTPSFLSIVRNKTA